MAWDEVTFPHQHSKLDQSGAPSGHGINRAQIHPSQLLAKRQHAINTDDTGAFRPSHCPLTFSSDKTVEGNVSLRKQVALGELPRNPEGQEKSGQEDHCCSDKGRL